MQTPLIPGTSDPCSVRSLRIANLVRDELPQRLHGARRETEGEPSKPQIAYPDAQPSIGEGSKHG